MAAALARRTARKKSIVNRVLGSQSTGNGISKLSQVRQFSVSRVRVRVPYSPPDRRPTSVFKRFGAI